jgi:hypothetical protein
MAAKDQPAQGDLITLDVAGRLLMIGAERVRQLIKAGYIQRPKPGHTTIVSAVQGYIRFLKDEDRKDTKKGAAARATDARTREIELRIAERKRDLIPQEDAKAVVAQLAATMKAEFVGLPARMTRDMVERRRLEHEIDASFGRIADALESAEAALAVGFGDHSPEPEA